MATSKESLISGEALVGSIVIGPLAEFHETGHTYVQRPLGTIDGVEVFGLSSPDRPDKMVAYNLIAGGECALIGDQNPQLAELLLKLSERRSKSLPASK